MPLPPLLMPLDVSAPAAEPAATGAGQGRAPAAGLTEEEVAQAIDDFLAEYGGEEEDYGEDDLSDEVSDLEELPELRPPLVLGD